MLSTAQKHVDSIGSLQKSNLVLLVTSDEGNNDNFGLFALKVV